MAASDVLAVQVDPIRPPLYFAVLLGAAWLGAAHEVLFRQLALYLDAGVGPSRAAVTAAALVAGVGAALAVGRWLSNARAALPWLCLALAVVTSVSAPALMYAFGKRSLFAPTVWGVSLAVGAALGSVAAAGAQATAFALRGVGALPPLLNAFRVLGFGVAFGVAASAVTVIGPWRAGAALALVLSALAAWCAPLFFYLERLPAPGAQASRAAAWCVFALALAALAAAELVVPLEELAFYEGDVVYASSRERRRYVVTSAQKNLELFVDRMLKLSDLDAYRYYELLVHPAMATAKRQRSVLILGAGDGFAEREVLRWSAVERVRLVTLDGRLAELAQSMPWLIQRTGGALADPRVSIVEREPIRWLDSAPNDERFDVAIVDLGDPAGYAEGKHYTRWFYQRLAERLNVGGVGVVQATSPFGTPKTYGTIVATLRDAGLSLREYQAPVPTLGIWGFVLLSREPLQAARPLPAGLRYLTASTFRAALATPPDVTPPMGLGVNLLYEQPLVDLLAEERGL
jgi:spermidine synthase